MNEECDQNSNSNFVDEKLNEVMNNDFRRKFDIDNDHDEKEYFNKFFIKSPKQYSSEDSCDFSETSINDNIITIPPKLVNRCSLLKFQSDGKIFSKPKKHDTEMTVVEYESLLTEEVNFKKSENFDKFDNVLDINNSGYLNFDLK